MKKVIIIGGIGNGTVIASAIADAEKRGHNDWEVAGFLNDRTPIGETIEGNRVLGTLADVDQFLAKDFHFIYTVYKIEGNRERLNLFNTLNIPAERLATFIHPSAYVAEDVELSPGTVIMPNASISPGVSTGFGCLVMVGASLGHNTQSSSHCHFAAQSVVGAYCKIETGVHVGLNSTIRENVNIGKHSTLGMGSVLLENIPENEVWAGNPARRIKRNV